MGLTRLEEIELRLGDIKEELLAIEKLPEPDTDDDAKRATMLRSSRWRWP